MKRPPAAKPAKGIYRRNLPHVQPEDRTLFITFCTYRRWKLPEAARTTVLEHCLAEHGVKVHVHGVVVMPDHVHMVATPLRDVNGRIYGLAEILGGIKGASAHCVNRKLQRKGSVWQAESFDHVLRSHEGVRQKVEYICGNPLRRGLAKHVDEYAWLWREWVEGV